MLEQYNPNKDAKAEPCCCATATLPTRAAAPRLATAAGLIALWVAVYANLPAFADYFAFSLAGLEPGTHLGEAVRFFVYDTPKVLMLLALIVFFVGIVRSYFTPEASKRLLSGNRQIAGNGLAALLGVATPFCSCSAVPLFVGFVTAGVPLGVTFSFLIASPMVNEVALVLLYGLFGWKVALAYMGAGLLLAVVAGWAIGRMKLEHHLQPWVRQQLSMNGGPQASMKLTVAQRMDAGVGAVRDVVGKVWLYVIIGIGVGAAIHGYVPEDFMAQIMGKSAWWAVPLAVTMGVPMYTNAAGVVPVLSALIGKGAALGTALAFMMSVIALSLPEMLMLKKVLQIRLLATFVGVVAGGILLVGWGFNLLF